MATYKIVSHGGNGLPLNVETTSTISGRTNVNIWKDTGSNDQKWSINSLGTSQQVRTLNNTTYMLNAYVQYAQKLRHLEKNGHQRVAVFL